MSTADDRAGVPQPGSEPGSLTVSPGTSPGTSLETSPEIGPERESDTSLVERMKTGDVEALSLIFDRYSPPVFAMLMDLLEDSVDAEEVLRDLFIQLWQRAADFDPGSGSLPAWLMVIGHHLARARLRASRHRDAGDDFESYPANGIPSPFENEEQLRIMAERLRTAWSATSPEQRHAMELAFRGWTQTEIALQTGRSRETLRSSLLRTINSLIETYGNARNVGRL